MKLDTTTYLDDYDDEDIFDVVVALQNSLGLTFKDDAFKHAQTFGDLCEVFDEYLSYGNVDDCTSQQTFYKVRHALHASLQPSIKPIRPETLLTDIFPAKGRKQAANAFKDALGVKVRLFAYGDNLTSILLLVVLLSLVELFFIWKIALCTILMVSLLFYFEEALAVKLKHRTVAELVRQLTSEYYAAMRRHSDTMNHREVVRIIKQAFSESLSIEEEQLTSNARFSWAEKSIST